VNVSCFVAERQGHSGTVQLHHVDETSARKPQPLTAIDTSAKPAASSSSLNLIQILQQAKDMLKTGRACLKSPVPGCSVSLWPPSGCTATQTGPPASWTSNKGNTPDVAEEDDTTNVVEVVSSIQHVRAPSPPVVASAARSAKAVALATLNASAPHGTPDGRGSEHCMTAVLHARSITEHSQINTAVASPVCAPNCVNATAGADHVSTQSQANISIPLKPHTLPQTRSRIFTNKRTSPTAHPGPSSVLLEPLPFQKRKKSALHSQGLLAHMKCGQVSMGVPISTSHEPEVGTKIVGTTADLSRKQQEQCSISEKPSSCGKMVGTGASMVGSASNKVPVDSVPNCASCPGGTVPSQAGPSGSTAWRNFVRKRKLGDIVQQQCTQRNLLGIPSAAPQMISCRGTSTSHVSRRNVPMNSAPQIGSQQESAMVQESSGRKNGRCLPALSRFPPSMEVTRHQNVVARNSCVPRCSAEGAHARQERQQQVVESYSEHS
jgi:hypothetical protein